ncbi:DUF3052 family protein [Massilia sp. TSP1-1-2]|uniref:DUF3052 family protein n=1 Tax=unclassified Massilia TaxID=2609279 RepID=UPI003CF9BD55
MSDKTIADKMYLKTAKSLAIFNGGAHQSLVDQLPQDMIGVDEAEADAVLVFALSEAELDKWWEAALARLGEKGSLWIAFLKQSAPKATDLNRDVIYEYASARGVTGVALISMDADWSAVRLKRI